MTNRRDVLRLLTGASLAVPLLPLFGCGTEGESLPDAGDGDSTPGSWAAGGTAAMTDKASYPSPFTGALSSCMIVASTTEGPCTTQTDLLREDVSEGWTGLPVRFALQVVDASCNPLVGATVKIWHTNLEGSYSGATPNNNMCLEQQAYSTQDFFRGTQPRGRSDRTPHSHTHDRRAQIG